MFVFVIACFGWFVGCLLGCGLWCVNSVVTTATTLSLFVRILDIEFA